MSLSTALPPNRSSAGSAGGAGGQVRRSRRATGRDDSITTSRLPAAAWPAAGRAARPGCRRRRAPGDRSHTGRRSRRARASAAARSRRPVLAHDHGLDQETGHRQPASGALDQRVAVGPIEAAPGEQPHALVPHHEPVTVVLDHPQRPGGRRARHRGDARRSRQGAKRGGEGRTSPSKIAKCCQDCCQTARFVWS